MTREPIEAGEKGRGYEVGKNQYLLMEEDELDAVAIECNQIDSFVSREQMDGLYLGSSYYPVPTSRRSAKKHSRLFGMHARQDMVVLGRIVLAKRERVVMLPVEEGSSRNHAAPISAKDSGFSWVTNGGHSRWIIFTIYQT